MSVNAEQMSADALALRLFSSNERLAVADARRLLDELKGAYAHELAEKIRNSKRLRDCTDDHMGDMNEAANEIDPEVSSG